MKINTKKGFSLIELSIVLIIIGLLVAGITGGASLIKSAELRSTISEIRNYQTAVNAYYTAVGELPGTNNSSEINFADSALAWGEMQSEGIIDSNLSNTDAAATSLSSANSLPSKYKGAYYALGYNDAMKQNVVFLFSNSEAPADLKSASGTAANTLNASITIKDTMFIDEKMDNGKADSGKVYAFGSTVTGGCDYASTSLNTKACTLGVGLGL